ncbi:MAG TPA: crotonyl-CoA carboxylase/reductase [Ilumatobacteraceae bacterium]|nr:crotonyl-CoA carboxylase/reductase [Ilumatobacteraceae bacterium]HUC31827.1 crotonyl-CoA carboxylase/reductase [Ilumatobacteraceae bacterium]
MQHILDAIESGASADDFAALPVPESYRAAHVRKDDQEMWVGVPSRDKDPRKSLHIGDVPTPELAPDEAYVAVMASSINFNTVWTSIFEPVSTFGPIARLARESEWAKRHDQPYQVVGSDASGVVLRVGSAVRNWKPGDRVTVHCNHVDDQDPSAHDDSMLANNQRIWGYETNFGGLADLAVVKANQLMPKPEHLTWEEAAVNALCNSTSYRMLVSHNGAQMKQGDVVLIWGATGGIGAYATQYVLNGGGIPVCVVSSAEKGDILRNMGVEHIIDRAAAGYRFLDDDGNHDEGEWRRLGKDIRSLCGEDPDIVFEHPGRSTFAASMYVAKRGGTVVTCAATSGFMMEFDNRHFWMRLKRLIGSHFANYKEAYEANRLISKGMIQPVLSQVFPLEHTGEAAYQVHHNMHEGKIGVLALAPTEGLGVTDHELRDKVGDRLRWFRR